MRCVLVKTPPPSSPAKLSLEGRGQEREGHKKEHPTFHKVDRGNAGEEVQGTSSTTQREASIAGAVRAIFVFRPKAVTRSSPGPQLRPVSVPVFSSR